MNQLAMPGLGSWMAGRRAAGIGQLLLAAGGSILVVWWFVDVLLEYYAQISGDSQPKSYAWLGEGGALAFIAAWLWALGTSLSLVRRAKAEEQADPGRVPPKIGSPPANPGSSG